MTAFKVRCFRCRQKQFMSEPYVHIFKKNTRNGIEGGSGLKGSCSVCGCKMFMLLPWSYTGQPLSYVLEQLNKKYSII